ncbi:MAG: sigma-54-dependent Fis family transcriptional regulator, partial [Deltaproteobacteria bacterium]|nr:sigma-54-dependent Fis family transcriptional regulator [Deltaproteobacteria bacterium]
IARRIHAIDEGENRPLVVVNCGAIPEGLVESELFGHKRGAFTSADKDKAGKFELAHGGTLFLDEIGELPLAAQAKLLRAVEDGQFFRVGGTKPVNVSCRIVTATNRNLEEMVKRKLFREDLYYRLNVVRIRTTPLRARLEDIPDLARFFVLQIGGSRMSMSDTALKRLIAYEWPGNIRELRNTIERAIIAAHRRASDEIDAQDVSLDGALDDLGLAQKRIDTALPTDVSNLTATDYQSFLETAEREFLRLGLHLMNGNAAELAARIGLARSTIFKKLALYGLGKRLQVDAEASATDSAFANQPSPGGLQ